MMEGLEAKAIEIALKDGVSGTPDGLDIRYGISPRLDLLDASKNEITQGEWLQPATGTYSAPEVDTLIYGGIRNQWQKVVVLTGIRALQSQVYATSLRLEAGPSTIAIEDIQDLVSSSPGESYGAKEFERPYFYNTKIGLKVYLRPKTDGVGQRDKLLFTGFVIEPKGVNVV